MLRDRTVPCAGIEPVTVCVDRPRHVAKPLAFGRLTLAVSLLMAVGCSSAETPEVAAAEVENAFANTKLPEAEGEAARADGARGQTAVDAFMAEVEVEEEKMAQIKAEAVADEETSR